MTSPAKTPKDKFLELSTYLQDEVLDKVWDSFSQIQEDDQLVHNNLSEIEKKYQALFLNWKKMKQSDIERQHEDIVSQYEFTKTISDQKIACVTELFDEIQLQKTKLDGIIEEYIESQEKKDQLRELMKTRDKNLQDDFKRLNKNLKRKYRKLHTAKQERQQNPSASSSKEKVSVKKTSTTKAAKAVVEAKKSTENQTVSLPVDTASESKVSIENQVATEKVSTPAGGSSDSQNCQIVSASSCDPMETSINATSSTSFGTNESADLEDSPKSVAYILGVIGAISNPTESAESQATATASLEHQDRPTASSEATCQITSPDSLQKDQCDRPSAGQVDSRPQTAGTTSQETSEINKREVCSEEVVNMSLVTAEQSQQHDQVEQATEQQESRQSDQRDDLIQSQTIIQPKKPEPKLVVETTVGCTKASSTTADDVAASATTLATDPLKRHTGSNKPIGSSRTKKYCICKKEAYGEMVGCENSECPIEWFHYSCVNLDAPPEIEWYCTQCDTEEKRQNKSSNRQI